MIRVLAAVAKIQNCHGKNRRIDTLGKRLAAFLVQPFPFITIRVKKEGNQMEIADIRNQLNQMNEKINSFRGLFDLDQLEEAIAEAEHQMADPTFWDDSEQAQKVINENNANKETYDQFNQLAEEFEELEVLLEMIQEEPDAEMEAELAERIQALNEKWELMNCLCC